MGCAPSKSSTNSPSNQLNNLKMANGYVSNGELVGHRRSTGQRLNKSDPPPNNFSGGGDRKLSDQTADKDGIFGGGRGGRGRTLLVDESDEVVDGWPKWLTDNVPREVLAGVIQKSAENYDKIDKVGQGTYSNVYKARDRDTGKVVALKKVKFDTSEPESVKFMAREIMMLQKLDHPNVVKLEGIATSRMQYSLYLVFEFMQSDLATIITRPEGSLTEPQVKLYMQQLLSGLHHCHERGILHRDIKGSNLLIDKNGMLKIADFGLANCYSSDHNKRPLTSRVVTLWYRAPELLLGSTDYGVGIDLWSVGCLLAEMFAGRPIMPGRTEVEQLHRIFKLCGTPSENYWKKLRLSTTFRPPKSYKPSLFEAFGEFPESSLGLLSTLLALDPAYRGSAASALQNDFFCTNPLACDLSGLPVFWREEDELAQANELKKLRNSKMKRRSRTYREQRRNDFIPERPKENSTLPKQDPAHSIEEAESSAFLMSPQNSSSNKQKVNSRTQGLPPLPAAYKLSNYNEGKYRLNQVNRSASTREFRKLNQRKHIEIFAVDN
ncbi:probable serine/threonine-protein kinase At1g54610 [Mercurialis annua]|uniref:probable serine/threonine-protein kinase At1g54610 n=1 Tax=Mercurialis annua TaxID=3986 RepID=UPI002160D599|nr:probable serine/threonine-protein kinase At1g54610 [Mercurialis annua]